MVVLLWRKAVLMVVLTLSWLLVWVETFLGAAKIPEGEAEWRAQVNVKGAACVYVVVVVELVWE